MPVMALMAYRLQVHACFIAFICIVLPLSHFRPIGNLRVLRLITSMFYSFPLLVKISLLSWSMSHLQIAHRLFLPQDHRCHEYHISDHVILPFEHWHSSNILRGSGERRIDECYVQSSIQEYDTFWNFGRDRDFYQWHPISRELKRIALFGIIGRTFNAVRRSKQEIQLPLLRVMPRRKRSLDGSWSLFIYSRISRSIKK